MIVLETPTKLKTDSTPRLFLQRMVNRLYASRHKSGRHQMYMFRLKDMVKKYERTGNTEFLVDAANYCLLEAEFPCHPNAHFQPVDQHGKTEKA